MSRSVALAAFSIPVALFTYPLMNTDRVYPTPESLILKDADNRKRENPEKTVLVDLYQVSMISNASTLDSVANNFFSSTVFGVERKILKQLGAIDSIEPVPKQFAVGTKTDIWTVKERNDTKGELLLSWETPLIPFKGSSYFCVRQATDNFVAIQFGSVLECAPNEVPSGFSLFLHRIYSKLLLGSLL